MSLSQFLAIVELRTKIVSLSTFSLALIYAVSTGREIPLGLALLTLAAALAVDMGTTAFNSYFDYLRRVDHRRYNRESDKVIVHRGVDPGAAFFSAAGCFAAAVVLGGIIALLRGWEIAAVGAACMAVGFLYTGGPRPISSTPLGELFAGGFLGSVFFLITFYILTGGLTHEALLASLPSALMIASILSVNNACDIEGDRAAGRKTLAILVGPKAAAALVPGWGGLTLATTAFLVILAVLPYSVAAGLVILLPPAVVEYRRMFTRGFSHETKGPNMGSISRIFKLFSLGYGAGLLAGLWI